jgi:hypothetical protein
METLVNKAEIHAEKAENFRIFSGIKLLHIRKQVEEILKFIGTGEIFDQYTKHDITHVDEMLKILDWLIPKKTSEKIKSAEWLMLVLSIYFHDMGMVVTKDEYENRYSSDYAAYKEKVMNGEMGIEYKEKVVSLGDEAEKFIYQEFVRGNHAARIKNIIIGNSDNTLGNTYSLTCEVGKILENLDNAFRRDLAKICESHNMDIDDFDVFKTSYCYGNSEDETVNLNYIALILRTADLLHITCDRTPTIQYHLINPSDPISILEWQKQMGVKAVRPKRKKSSDSNDRDLQPDTIEITAYFDKDEKVEAYFGLTSYLSYVRNELKKNYDIAKKAAKTQGAINYDYPWLYVDDDNVKAKDFEKKQLQFNLDQNSILQLLVGHTLYNDTSVVFRELIQNSLDAVSLQDFINKRSNIIPPTPGMVTVKWVSDKRELSFIDNGTGMTIYEIESFFFKVGASKYRTKEFEKDYSGFSAISRFGIGILTCFLVSNDIKIITNSEDEKYANMISIRKVDGKYLLKKFDKNTLDKFIRKHGTNITLQVRADINLKNLEKILKKWILFPLCEVNLIIDDQSALKIGYGSPAEALESIVKKEGFTNLNVNQKSIDGLDIAYLTEYNEYFRIHEFYDERKSDYFNSVIGTCINGIRVNNNTPGFERNCLVAVANATGSKVPKTNVARSEIETSEKEVLFEKVYTIYSDHVQEQIIHMQNEGFSLEWSVREANHIVNSLTGNLSHAENELFCAYLKNIRCIIIENGNGKNAVSPNDVSILPEINIISGKIISSAESLLGELPTQATIKSIINGLVNADALKIDRATTILYNYSSFNFLHKIALAEKEVSNIVVYPQDRRIDLKFLKKNERWLVSTPPDPWRGGSLRSNNSLRINNPFERYSRPELCINIPMQQQNIIIEGITNKFAIKAIDQLFLMPNHFITEYIIKQTKNTHDKVNIWMDVLRILFDILIDDYIMSCSSQSTSSEEAIHYIQKNILEEINKNDRAMFEGMININELVKLVLQDIYTIFDPDMWYRDSQLDE